MDVPVGEVGKTSNINLFRSSQNKFDESQKFLGDKAYKGEADITTPHQKSKNGEITESQLQENKELSSSRIIRRTRNMPDQDISSQSARDFVWLVSIIKK